MKALVVLHYASPALLASYFLAASTINCFTKPCPRATSKRCRAVSLALSLIFVVTYLIDGVLYLSRVLTQHGWWAPQHAVMYKLVSALVWGCFTLVLLESPFPAWLPYVGLWPVAGILSIPICVLSAITQLKDSDHFDEAHIFLEVIRTLTAVSMSVYSMSTIFQGYEKGTDEEVQSLLGEHSETGQQYGTTVASEEDGGEDDESESELKERQRKRLKEQGVLGYLKGFRIFLRHLWPSGDRRVQLYLIIMFLCVLAQRALNILVPRQLGIITNKLAPKDNMGTTSMPWKELSVWVTLKLFESSAGLGFVKGVLSSRYDIFCYKRITTLSFGHLLGLSMDFHNDKDTGEVLSALSYGRSLNMLIDLVLFDAGPVILDLIVGLCYTNYLFDAYLSFIFFVSGLVYIWVGVRVNLSNVPKRRKFVRKANEEFKILVESVSNWSTISYFNRNQFEQERFGDAVDAMNTAQCAYYDGHYVVGAAQSLVKNLGLLSGSLLAVFRVSQGTKDVGSFITLITYWGSFWQPLRMLSDSYKRISSSLIDAERLLQLLQTHTTVSDAPGAAELGVTGGKVEFDNVSFAYDERKQTLENLSFVAEPGKSIAFVGETGGGKSTILKLLFRFYDVTGGSIRVDGQDIRKVTLSSLREALGVVPQDPTLFNQTIMDNIRYARLDAPDEEVYEACKAAAIHDKIMTFPDGYKSKVGERGVKLSGGELQRVAIARVILKDPRIVLLDEATSAVDSATEAQIQQAFKKLSRGRTTFVIAHRLSTIMDADLILVIDNGEIIERGTHFELLGLNGKYVNLWSKQTKQNSEASSVTVKDDGLEASVDGLPKETYSAELAEAPVKDGKEDSHDVEE